MLVVTPDAITIGRTDMHTVGTGAHLCQCHTMIMTDICPCLTVFHPVGVCHQLCILIIQCCKVYGKIPFVGIHDNHIILISVVFNDMIVFCYTGNHQGRYKRILFQFVKINQQGALF